MFPGAMNSVNIKKVSELWEDEKKYRWWIFGFALSLFVLFALHLALTISVFLFKNQLIEHYKVFSPETASYTPLWFAENQFQGFAMTLIGMSIALFFCLSIFSYSIFNCYKIKSFEKLDSISSFFLGFQVFFTFLTLIQTFMFGANFNIISGNNLTILAFVLKFLLIPVWLLLSQEVKKIKRTFFLAKRQEEINAFYENNQQQMNQTPFQQNPFGFPFQQKNNQSQSAKKPIDVTPEVVEKDKRNLKLKLMTISQLRKIADKLSISGSKDMNKSELIKIILSISQSFENKEVKEKQAESKEKNKKEVDSEVDSNNSEADSK